MSKRTLYSRVVAYILILTVLSAVSIPRVSGASATAGQSGKRLTGLAVSDWTETSRYEQGRVDLSAAKVDGTAVSFDGGSALLLPNHTFSVDFTVSQAGSYVVALNYEPIDAKVQDCDVSVVVDDKTHDGWIPLLWTDRTDDYSQDTYGNDLLPEQAGVAQFVTNPIEDAQSVSKTSLRFSLRAGAHSLRVTTKDQKIRLGGVYAVPFTEPETYAAYLSAQPAGASDGGFTTIEAEKYSVKSDSFIHGVSVRNPALYPYATFARKINVIDGNSWDSAGQKVAWEFSVDRDGYYQLGFHYAQSSYPNKASYRQIAIDGKTPFSAFSAVAFPQTPGSKYENLIPAQSDGKAYRIYLTKGRHVISMCAVLGPNEDAYKQIMEIMDRINDISYDIQNVTSGISDKNRTWNMNVYFPGVVSGLTKCAAEIDAVYQGLGRLTGNDPTYANDLKYASKVLHTLLSDPPTLPNKFDLLSEGDQSANKYLGNVLSTLTSQPLSLDRIYVYGEGSLPSANRNAFRNLWEGIKAFVYSFLPSASKADYSASYNKNSDALKVWMNRPIQYVQVLQQIVDADYNSKYHTNIQISVMPNEQKLILSNAAGTNPDVGISIGYTMPFDFAVRGAAKNLLDYPDFLKYYNDNFNLESLVPMCYNDGVYGTAETYDFQVLFYRKDILKSLGLSVPNTWNDVKQMMPTLLRHSMNFNLPIADSTGFKSFGATSPLIYQNKGSFYASNGSSAALTSRNTMDGFTELTDLFKIYSVQTVVPNFYNSFRFGQTPIGISSFSTYLQLKFAAPELTGRWAIALTPGEVQADGTVARYQSADSTACMIFKNTKRSAESWQFLKWWLSEQTQTRYAHLLESTLGPVYRWNTANLKAFAELPYSRDERDVILRQLSSEKETISHPAKYMVERETSNAWTNVVVNGKSLNESIDAAETNSNHEIVSKLQEFGYMDANGNMLRAYVTDTIDKLRKRLNEEVVK